MSIQAGAPVEDNINHSSFDALALRIIFHLGGPEFAPLRKNRSRNTAQLSRTSADEPAMLALLDSEPGSRPKKNRPRILKAILTPATDASLVWPAFAVKSAPTGWLIPGVPRFRWSQEATVVIPSLAGKRLALR